MRRHYLDNIFGLVILIAVAILVACGIINGFTPLFGWLDAHETGVLIAVVIVSIIASIIYTRFSNFYDKEKGSAGIWGYLNRVILIPPVMVMSIGTLVSVLSDMSGRNLLTILFMGLLLIILCFGLSLLMLSVGYFLTVKGSELFFALLGKIGLVIYTIIIALIEFFLLCRWEFLPFLTDMKIKFLFRTIEKTVVLLYNIISK